MQTELYTIQGVENIFTPALIYYKDEIFENTRKTIEIAGGAERLWPHVKSHKMKKMIKKYADMFEMKPLQNIQQKEKGQ